MWVAYPLLLKGKAFRHTSLASHPQPHFLSRTLNPILSSPSHFTPSSLLTRRSLSIPLTSHDQPSPFPLILESDPSHLTIIPLLPLPTQDATLPSSLPFNPHTVNPFHSHHLTRSFPLFLSHPTWMTLPSPLTPSGRATPILLQTVEPFPFPPRTSRHTNGPRPASFFTDRTPLALPIQLGHAPFSPSKPTSLPETPCADSHTFSSLTLSGTNWPHLHLLYFLTTLRPSKPPTFPSRHARPLVSCVPTAPFNSRKSRT